MVCSMFGVENIYTNKEEKLVKENVLMNMPTGCEKLQISKHFTQFVSQTCELDRRRVYYFSTDCTAVGSSCFASEANHSRSILYRWQNRQKSKQATFVSAQIHVVVKMPSANVSTQEDSSGLL